MRMRTLAAVLTVALAGAFGACNEDGGGVPWWILTGRTTEVSLAVGMTQPAGGHADGRSGPLTVATPERDPANARREPPLNAIQPQVGRAGTAADVTSVTVEVNLGSTPLGTTTLTGPDASGNYTGTVAGLPVGESLNFIARGFEGATETFTGNTIQTLAATGNAVVIDMAPASDGQTVLLPRVTKITRPAEILEGTTGNVQVFAEGQSGETLSWSFLPAPGESGGFAPATGTIPLAGTAGSFVSAHTAPAVSLATRFIHAVRVENAAGHAVETEFDVNVDFEAADAGITARFNPVILALTGRRASTMPFY